MTVIDLTDYDGTAESRETICLRCHTRLRYEPEDVDKIDVPNAKPFIKCPRCDYFTSIN